ncbi:MAG: hypothetical protein AB8I08_03005 [Sandaracinaceae bacterium]
MSRPAHVAGSILPLSSPADELDVLVARAYAHPALPSPMVRLGPGAIDEAVDLEMDLLGFTPSARDEVGRVPRQPLGFPAWALVHDKKNARFALDVLEEMKTSIRRMKSKPGTAKEGLDAIGAKLAGSVPHFLPSFYEEAARAFIAHDNISYAQQYFERARAAERQYGLEVDEELREKSFVDFALAGALAVKSLTNYADELSARGKDGLDAYLRVSVRRTLGGLPPSATQLKDIAKLAKAAGLTPADAERDFITQIASASALRRASKGFYTKAKKSLAAAAKQDIAVASAFLDLWPGGVDSQSWLALLDDWGLLDALADADAPGQSQRTTAAWMTSMLEHCWGERALGVLERAADRLIAEAIPLGGKEERLSLDTVETCLRLGIPHVFESFENLESYRYADSPRWPSVDLPRIAEDPNARARFLADAGRLSGSDYADLPDVDLPAFNAMLDEAMAKTLASIGQSGLYHTKEALELLGGFPARYWKTLPALRDAFRRIDVPEAFAAQLRFGCIEEICFPEFEAMAVKDQEPGFCVTWPFTTLWTKKQVRVFDRDGALVLEHKVRGGTACRAMYVGEDLLVCLSDEYGYNYRGYYWASAPKDVHPISGWVWNSDNAVRLPGGDVIAAGLIRAGSTTLRSEDLAGRPQVHDGTVLVPRDEGWVRYDASTGAFVEDEAEQTKRWAFHVELDPREGAPVRAGNGVFAYAMSEGGAEDGEGAVPGPMVDQSGTSDALIQLPHREAPCLFEESYEAEELRDVRGVQYSDGDDLLGAAERRFAGKMALPMYRPSDAAASAQLSTIQADELASLLEVAQKPKALEVTASSWTKFKPHRGLLEALDALVTTSYAPLRAALAGIAHYAGHVAAAYEEVREDVGDLIESTSAVSSSGDTLPRKTASKKKSADALPKRDVGNPTLTDALGDFAYPLDAGYRDRTKGPTLASELGELRLRFDRPVPKGHDEYIWGHHCWQPGLGHGAYVLYRMALAPKKASAAREQLASFARLLLQHGFEDRDHYRLAFRKENTASICKSPYHPTLAARGDNRVFAWQLGYEEDAMFTFLEYAPKGVFEVIADPDDNLYGPCWLTADRIEEVVAHVEAAGPLPIRKAVPLLCEATGMTESEATMWALAEFHSDPFKLVKKASLRWVGRTSFEHDPFVSSPGHMLHTLDLGSSVFTSGDYKELWDPKVLAERLAGVFLRHRPQLPTLTAGDEAVLAKHIRDEADLTIDEPSWAARLLANDTDGVEALLPFLHQDREHHFDKDGYHVRGVTGGRTTGRGFHSNLKWDYIPESLERIVVPFVRGLYACDGHALLVRSLPRVFRLLQERLQGPGLYQEIELHRDVLDTVRAALPKGGPSSFQGKKPKTLLGDDRCVYLKTGQARLWLRYDAIVEGDTPMDAHQDVRRLRQDLTFLMGPTLARMIALAEQVAGSERCAGDPRVSAPKVVEGVAERLSVSSDAAAYFLMLACLPSPTDKHVGALAGWDANTLDALGAELGAGAHIVEGKRAGAGRTRFVPGLWVKDKHRVSAVRWTRELFGWGTETDRHAPDDAVFRGAFPPMSPDALYEAAWARIEAGDGPGLDEPGS